MKFTLKLGIYLSELKEIFGNGHPLSDIFNSGIYFSGVKGSFELNDSMVNYQLFNKTVEAQGEDGFNNLKLKFIFKGTISNPLSLLEYFKESLIPTEECIHCTSTYLFVLPYETLEDLGPVNKDTLSYAYRFFIEGEPVYFTLDFWEKEFSTMSMHISGNFQNTKVLIRTLFLGLVN